MFRIIKIFLLVLFIIISTVGFIMSTWGYFGVILIGEAALPKWIFAPIFGIPIVFIPAIIVAIGKTVKYNGECRYGIRFWPAIKNLPKQCAIIIYVLSFNIAIILIIYSGHGKDSLAISSSMMLFYYLSTIIYLSSLKNILK